MTSRCPFLARVTVQQLKGARDNVIGNIARKCPVASQQLPASDGDRQMMAPCKTAEGCPFMKSNARQEKEIKQIAMKCCGAAPNLNADLMIGAAKGALKKKHDENTYRIFKEVERSANEPGKCQLEDPANVTSVYGSDTSKTKINWSSNDYLGLSQHPRVIDKTIRVITENGVGSGGTRNISGTSPYHVSLEERLADWHNHAQALVFSSCYVANENVISQLASLCVSQGKQMVLISDEKNHASMIQGVKAAVRNSPSMVSKRVFRHNDMGHLEEILREVVLRNVYLQGLQPGAKVTVPAETVPVVLFESVYSMDGNLGDVDSIAHLAQKYDAMTFCDEVHAVGLYGRGGHGFCQPHHQIDFITGTLGKALGSMGGYVTSSNADFIEYFRLHCPGLIFTTSLPPAIAAAADEALKISMSPVGDSLRKKHRANVDFAKSLILEFLPDHADTFATSNHIIPIFVNDATQVAYAQYALDERGHYAQAINYPTVPKGTERLRLVVSPMHSEWQIRQLVDDLADSLAQAGLRAMPKQKSKGSGGRRSTVKYPLGVEKKTRIQQRRASTGVKA